MIYSLLVQQGTQMVNLVLDYMKDKGVDITCQVEGNIS